MPAKGESEMEDTIHVLYRESMPGSAWNWAGHFRPAQVDASYEGGEGLARRLLEAGPGRTVLFVKPVRVVTAEIVIKGV
jgi:hypothetical protein